MGVDGSEYGAQVVTKRNGAKSAVPLPRQLALLCPELRCAPWAVAVAVVKNKGNNLLKLLPSAAEGPPGRLRLQGLMGPTMVTSLRVALASVRLNWERLVAVLMPTASHEDKVKATCTIFETPLLLHSVVSTEGGSAGLAAFLTLVGFAMGLEFRDDTVVTGQITAGGRVLGVGSCAAKGKAALDNGRKRFVLPSENAGELKTLEAKKGLEVHTVKDVWEALPLLLVTQPLAAPDQPGPHAQGQEAGG